MKTDRPRPFQKPVYTYPKPTTATTSVNTFSHHVDQQHLLSTQLQRPSSWDHESNQISSSPSFYPLVHPGEHFGNAEEDGFGADTDAGIFSHTNFGESTTYTEDNYRPTQGISH